MRSKAFKKYIVYKYGRCIYVIICNKVHQKQVKYLYLIN